MTIFNLLAYILIVAIYAYGISLAAPLPLPLCATFLCLPSCLVGLGMAWWRGEIRDSLRELIREPSRRRALAALSLLGIAIPIITLEASKPADSGDPILDGTLRLALSVFTAALLSWPTSRLFQQAPPPRQAAPGNTGELPLSAPSRSNFLWRSAFTVAAVGFICYFLYRLAQDGAALPLKTRILAPLWAALAVAMLQLTRSCFATRGVGTASFLLCRYLGPALFFLIWTLVDFSLGRIQTPLPAQALQTLIALGAAATALSWMQYDCLRHYQVVALCRGLLLTPMLTYLICYGMDGQQQQGDPLWPRYMVTVVLSIILVLSAMMPWEVVPNTLRGVIGFFRHDPVAAIGAKVFYRSALATGLTVLMFLPGVHYIWRKVPQPMLLTMLGTTLFFSVALICRVLERLVNYRLAVVRKMLHDINAPFHMLQALRPKLRDPDLTQQDFLRYLDDLRPQFELAFSLALSIKDELKTDQPLLLQLDHHDLLAFLAQAKATLEQAVLRGQVPVHIDADPDLKGTQVAIDQPRVFLVLYNLTLNSVAAWRKERGPDLFGLRLRWEVRREGGAVRVVVRDNGRGVPSAIARQINADRIGVHSLCVGLGLLLSRRTVEAHGGRFHVAGRRGEHGPQRGAEITMTLPIP